MMKLVDLSTSPRFLSYSNIFVLFAAYLILSGSQFEMPKHDSPLGLNFPGVLHFQESVLGRNYKLWQTSQYNTSSIVSLTVCWLTYGSLLILVSRFPNSITNKQVILFVVFLNSMIAFFGPPSLSSDVYSYVANARTFIFYDANPYQTSPAELGALSDETFDFVHYVDNPCVYGPVWLQLVSYLLIPFRSASLWTQVVLCKLFAGFSLVSIAYLGQYFRGKTSIIAIGLNPLFIMEGPLNGHNDFVMMLFLLLSLIAWQKNKFYFSSLFLGVSIGIKYLPLVCLPWLIVISTRKTSFTQGLKLSTTVIVLTLAPTFFCFIPFWTGLSTFDATFQRLQWTPDFHGHFQNNVADTDPLLANHGRHSMTQFVFTQIPVLFIYLLTLFSIVLNKNSWAICWVIISSSFFFLTFAVRYPWYLAWPLVFVILMPHRYVSPVYYLLGIYYSFSYFIFS